MTAYRDRMLNGDYKPKADTKRTDGNLRPKTTLQKPTKRRSSK